MSAKNEQRKRVWNLCHFIDGKSFGSAPNTNYNLPVLGYTKKSKAPVVSNDLTLLKDMENRKATAHNEKQIILKRDASGNFMLMNGTLVEVTPLKGSTLASKKITPLITNRKTSKAKYIQKPNANMQLMKIVKDKDLPKVKDKSPLSTLKEFQLKVAKNESPKEKPFNKTGMTFVQKMQPVDKDLCVAHVRKPSIDKSAAGKTTVQSGTINIDRLVIVPKQQTPSVSDLQKSTANSCTTQTSKNNSDSTNILQTQVVQKRSVANVDLIQPTLNRRKSFNDIETAIKPTHTGGTPSKLHDNNTSVSICKTSNEARKNVFAVIKSKPKIGEYEILKNITSPPRNGVLKSSNVTTESKKCFCDAATMTDTTTKSFCDAETLTESLELEETLQKKLCDAETLTEPLQFEETSQKKLCDAVTSTDDLSPKSDATNELEPSTITVESKTDFEEHAVIENEESHDHDWDVLFDSTNTNPIIGRNVDFGVEGTSLKSHNADRFMGAVVSYNYKNNTLGSAPMFSSDWQKEKFFQDLMNCTNYNSSGCL